mmetsp:Transcript_37120/g.111203  ORF Transcript_37120/g.111203 Transcript_37120/m.111203 type:complete len:286 (-) Transcript_37120:102-959(-)|eukprot:CAMPEP_0113550874 /NCGR_PEP_ID=MMETSP0015_2-20120614/14218_1 /TAXON_ID=2838 /ORGANISM="Odontella" /LENGTH=285 /DNA_ID=CAMNT_0000451717 /DNA_START=215 /DNA_END=1072 /DNA_ORIENTATION=+ /assembly_acc=CAM_ASM_000160
MSGESSDFADDDAKRHQTEAQLKAIEDDIKTNQPLTSDLLNASELVRMYESDSSDFSSSFLRGAKYLATKYNHLRKVRGDGNCYYRSFLYSVCESLLKGLRDGDDNAKKELERLQSFANSSLDEVTKRGYDKSAIEMFHEELVELFDFLAASECTSAALHAKLVEENAVSEYCTWYLRVVTAAYLKSDPDRFVHFLDEPYCDVASFCSREVEPMGRECGMVQVLALAEAMGVSVSIEYLDGRDFEDDKGLARHDFGPSSSGDGDEAVTEITLLYRPGHYDILYKN